MIIGSNLFLFILVAIVSKLFPISITSIRAFFIWGIVLVVVIGIIGATMNLLINPSCLKMLKNTTRKSN